MATEMTPEQKAQEARAERIAFMIVLILFLALVGGFTFMGITGVGLVAVALVPVIYVLLIIMAGGKG